MELWGLNSRIADVNDLAERASVLQAEIIGDFLIRADRKQPITQGDAHVARVKAEAVRDTIDEMSAALEALEHDTEPAKAAKASAVDHVDTAKNDRSDEILNDIILCFEQIEARPDWLKRLKKLAFCASALAAGCELTVTAGETGKA